VTRQIRHLLPCLFLLGASLVAGAASADEPLFGYVYTTDLLPKGKWEVEQWATDNDGQAHGYYHGLDGRTEVEYGLRDNIQVSLYWNYAYIDASRNSVRGLTEGQDIKASHDPTHQFSNIHNDGFSTEVVWRVLSPYTAPVGLAFYAEPEWGPKEYGIELRGIVQKNFMDDRLVLAANAWVEFEREAGTNLGLPGSEEGPDGAKADATYLEFDLGASYRFRPNWSFGLEFRNHNEYDGFNLDHSHQDHAAFFFGPNIHWAGQRWFFTLSALRQLGAIAYTPDQKAELYHGLLYGDEHTAWDGIRLRVGRTF
jgi:hypothetical protein